MSITALYCETIDIFWSSPPPGNFGTAAPLVLVPMTFRVQACNCAMEAMSSDACKNLSD